MSLLLGSNLAYGEILSMDLSGSPDSTENTFTFTQNGFILTATAIDENSDPAQVYQDDKGLGVLTSLNQNDDIDGAVPGVDPSTYHRPFEKLILSTNKEVKLVEATFSNADNNDEYRLFIDGVEIQQVDIGDNGITKVVSFESLEDDLRTGTEFAFSSTDVGDAYKVLSITFESLNDEQIIGGKIIPIETTSLILASTQSTSWLIPMIVSIAGFALVLIRRQN